MGGDVSRSAVWLLVACALHAAVRGETFTVRLDALGGSADIQSAIDQAAEGDVVLVASGEYVISEPLTFRGKAITVRGEGGPAETVLRLSAAPEPRDRASVVIFEDGEGREAVLEGLTLAGGRGTRSCRACPRRGGAVYCVDSSPSLRELRMEGSSAEFGGGVYLGGAAAPELIGCRIEENSAALGGGICIADRSAANISRCTIAENSAESGGGIYCSNAAPLIEECEIRGNEAGPSGEGGGAYCGDGAQPTLSGCAIRGNRAGSGGGVSCVRADAIMIGCAVSRNRASEEGGGIRCFNADPRLESCRITVNSAGLGSGGGLHLHFASPELTDCVVANNWAGRGGGVFTWIGEPLLVDCTITGNASPESHRQDIGGGVHAMDDWGATMLTLENCIVWGNTGTQVRGNVHRRRKNFFKDPHFCGWSLPVLYVDGTAEGAGDGTPEHPFPDLAEALDSYSLALRDDSPCIGAGEGGVDIGARLGLCLPGEASSEGVAIHLAPGTYDVEGLSLHRGVSLVGAGPAETLLRGTVRGLQTDSHIARLTVMQGEEGGVMVDRGQRVELREVTIRDNDGPGVLCDGATVYLERCTISGNRRRGDHAGGIWFPGAASVSLTSSILWNNGGGSLCCDSRAAIVARYSCIEGELRPGPGNINSDPRFCGWASGPEVYVDGTRSSGGDGSPERPFASLEEALDPAAFCLSLREDSPCRGSGERGENMGADSDSCEIPGSSSRLVHLAPGAYDFRGLTLLHQVSIEGAGAAETALEGTVEGLQTGAVLSRVTVRSGTSDGIVVRGSEAPRIEHVTVERNAGTGVVCLESASPDLVRCTIEANGTQDEDDSGGLLCRGSSRPSLTDSVIRDNLGPAITATGNSTASLERCWISANQHGLDCSDSAAPVLVDSVIRDNLGPAITAAETSSPSLRRCWISANQHGLDCSDSVAPVLINCVLTGNRAVGVVSRDNSKPALFHCTITGTVSERGWFGRGIMANGIQLANCIVWGNASALDLVHTWKITATHSLIELGDSSSVWPGEGNINTDPLFVSGSGDYRLRPGSPAIDTGVGIEGILTDIDGRPRPCGASPDMGAYEMGDCEDIEEPLVFLRGDCNGDGDTGGLSDAMTLLAVSFLGGIEPGCLAACDVDGDGDIAVSDAVALLNFNFAGGRPPDRPFPACGPSRRVKDIALGCESPPEACR